MNLAHQGYVVFAYDMVGYNDTKQTPHSFGGWREMLWGFSPMGLQLWNGIRALDFLESLPYVDKQRIAATGASGGGTQTFLLSAADERIRVAAPVNMISAHMQGGDPCEEAPGLRWNTFNVEIAATIAPRPMLIVSSTHDWTKNTPKEEFPAIQSIYALYGDAGKVENVQVDAEHNYNRQSREAVYAFLANRLKMDLSPPDLEDKVFPTPPDEEMLARVQTADTSELKNVDEVFEAWKVASLLQRERNVDESAARDALRYSLRASWPEQIESRIDGHRITLNRPGLGDRVTGYWRPGKGQPVVVVAPRGTEEALHTDLVEEIMQRGRPVLAIDPFQSGVARTRLERSYDYFYSYNASDASNRVQDILTALSFVSHHGTPELIGLRDSGVWCIFAAAIAPHDTDVIADLAGFGGSDEDFRDRFFVPGIQRAGGLSAALSLIGRMRVVIPSTHSKTNSPDVCYVCKRP
jgi:dienelactone hydrolase